MILYILSVLHIIHTKSSLTVSFAMCHRSGWVLKSSLGAVYLSLQFACNYLIVGDEVFPPGVLQLNMIIKKK